MRAAQTELEQFALEATVSPPRILAGQADNELPPLASEWRSAPSATTGEQCPLAPDELAVPAQEGVRADPGSRLASASGGGG